MCALEPYFQFRSTVLYNIFSNNLLHILTSSKLHTVLVHKLPTFEWCKVVGVVVVLSIIHSMCSIWALWGSPYTTICACWIKLNERNSFSAFRRSYSCYLRYTSLYWYGRHVLCGTKQWKAIVIVGFCMWYYTIFDKCRSVSKMIPSEWLDSNGCVSLSASLCVCVC